MQAVMVTTSAFLACHPCWSVGSSLGWGWNFQSVTFSEACCHQGFSLGTAVSSPPSSVNGFSQ